MAAILNRPGVWHRSGMEGVLSGLDWPAALASLPAELDMERAKRLLAVAENAFVSAWLDAAEAAENRSGKRSDQAER